MSNVEQELRERIKVAGTWLADLTAQNQRLVDTIKIHHQNFDDIHAKATEAQVGKISAEEFVAYAWQMTHPDPAQRGPTA
jgi:Zn-dependent protease with chaperone function